MKIKLSFKHLVPTMMLALLLIAGTLWAQDSKAFVGDWSGAVFIGGQEIDIVCHFELDEESDLKGTVDSPSQGAFGMALADIKVEGKKITFGIDDPNVSGEPQFDGMLDETGAKISGNFSQGGGEGTFELKKEQ
jgi:hypothetical protein